MQAAIALVVPLGARAACAGLGVPRASLYRARQARVPQHTVRRPRRSPLALDEAERAAILALLHSPEYVDVAPRTAYAMLLDAGLYLASPSTFYRLLRASSGTRARRDELRHPAYARPELLATAPRQVWSWDITKLKGPAKSAHFHLYVILDIFSRYVVGWMIADCELDALAESLIGTTCDREGIVPGTLTLHADRGAAMRSKLVADLLVDMGVLKSHSRPYTSDDNPFSEAQFKTMKYRPEFPERFGSLADARAFCQVFFAWYNDEHRHSGIGYMTPAAMHTGTALAIHAQRDMVLEGAFARHPNRFKQRRPQPPALPTEAGINMPKNTSGDETTAKIAL
nr:integrase core domain-containing protein [Janthinobacterium sp. PC23-8]